MPISRPTFGDDIPKWIVLCGCDDEQNPTMVAWIDDDRQCSGRIYVDSNHSWTETRHKDWSASTYIVRHKRCGMSLKLNELEAGELLDAIGIGKDLLGRSWIPVPHHLDPSIIERRQVLELAQLCRINGELQRRKTRPPK